MQRLKLVPPFGERPQPDVGSDIRARAAMDGLRNHHDVNRILEVLWRKDPYTYEHCHRVAELSQWIGHELGVSAQERVEIYICGLLHDVGKILTPDSVLKKPGPLTPEEFGIIRLHPADSGTMISKIPDLGYLTSSVRGHHERIDGRGYPDEKRGDKIPFYSRVILVADTFDAMTTNRVYRKQLDLGRTYDELHRCSGTQFDPEAVKGFIAMHQKRLAAQTATKSASNKLAA
jgi:HD-GYP domain-containing protein (c-di-GMP phosphodiesterase class II)